MRDNIYEQASGRVSVWEKECQAMVGAEIYHYVGRV